MISSSPESGTKIRVPKKKGPTEVRREEAQEDCGLVPAGAWGPQTYLRPLVGRRQAGQAVYRLEPAPQVSPPHGLLDVLPMGSHWKKCLFKKSFYFDIVVDTHAVLRNGTEIPHRSFTQFIPVVNILQSCRAGSHQDVTLVQALALTQTSAVLPACVCVVCVCVCAHLHVHAVLSRVLIRMTSMVKTLMVPSRGPSSCPFRATAVSPPTRHP